MTLIVGIAGRGLTTWRVEQHFDCRPPTCLSQRTKVLKEAVIPLQYLSNLRHPTLLVTSTDTATLLSRCSRGSLLRLSMRWDSSKSTNEQTHFPHAPSKIAVNLTGRIRHLVPTFCGEAMLVLGDNGRLQSWEVGDGVVTESWVADAKIKSSSRIATWHDGAFLVCETEPSRTLMGE